MQPNVIALDHINLPVYDARGALDFYTRVMGFRLRTTYSGDDWGGRRWLMLIFAVGDDRDLVLCKFEGLKKPSKGGLPIDAPHYAFAISEKDDLGRWKRRLVDEGIEFWEEDHGNRRSIYFPDPDGVIIEVTEAHAPETDVDPSAMEEALGWLDRHGE